MQICHSFDHLAHVLSHNMAHAFKHNVEQALEELGEQTKAEIESRIGNYPQNQGKSPAWQQLSDDTIRQKKKKGWGLNGNANSPLYASGAFAKSIGTDRSGTKFVVIGTNVDYIRYTEMGTAKMPARPVFQPSADYVIAKMLPRIQQLSAAGVVAEPVTHLVIK